MRLLLVSHKFTKGDGQGRVNYETARRALEQGHDVTLLATEAAPELTQHENLRWVAVPTRGWPTQLVRNLVFAARSARWIRQHRAEHDIVHLNGFITWEPGDVDAAHFVHSAWLRSPSHPFRARRGLLSAYQWLFTAWNALLERKAYRQAQRVVAVSEQVQRELRGIGVPADKITVIVNGVDLKEFRPGMADRAALGLPDRVVLALFVGDIRTSRKNLDTVLRALADVPVLHLAVVGDTAGSPYPAMAKTLGLDGRVHFLGYRRDVSDIMRASDFFVFPSRYEACSLVLLEALAAGLPVVTVRTTGGAEVVAQGGGVLLDSAEDVDALAQAMQTLTNDPACRADMGRAGRQIAQQHSWTDMADAYLSLYQELHAQKSQELHAQKSAAHEAGETGRSMKVLVISHSCVVDVNQQLFVDLNTLPGVDLELVVPALWRNEYTGQAMPPKLLPTVNFPVHPLPVALPGRVSLHFYRKGLTDAMRNAAPDVVFVDEEPWSLALAQTRLACRRLGIPFVCYTKQNIFKRYPFPFSHLEQAAYRAAATIIALSEEVQMVLHQKGFRGSCPLLAHACDLSLFAPSAGQSPLRTALGLSGKVMIGYMGRFVPEKGLDTLVDAVAQIAAACQKGDAVPDYAVLMVGAGPQMEELKVRAAAAGVADRFVWTGVVPHADAGRYMACMDIFVLPSRTTPSWKEQFGRVIIEALACAVPVAGSDSGQIPLLVADTGGGCVFHEGDPADLARVLLSLLRDPAKRRALGEIGRQAVQERYTFQAIAQQTHAILRDALPARAPLPGGQ